MGWLRQAKMGDHFAETQVAHPGIDHSADMATGDGSCISSPRRDGLAKGEMLT